MEMVSLMPEHFRQRVFSKWKGSEARACLACLRNIDETNKYVTEWARLRGVEENEVQEMMEEAESGG